MSATRVVGCGGCSKSPYTERTLVVRSAADLRALLGGGPRFERVVLHESVEIEFTGRQAITARLLRLYEECGCAAGAVGFLIALVVCLAIAAAGLQSLSFRNMGLSMFACLAGTLFGKTIGWAWGRWQLKREITRLGAQLDRRSSAAQTGS